MNKLVILPGLAMLFSSTLFAQDVILKRTVQQLKPKLQR